MSEVLVLFLASFLSGVIGAMGLGGGGVLILYLTIFLKMEQLAAQGTNLIFFIPIALLAVVIYAAKRQIEYKKILPFILGGLPTTLFAGFIANKMDTTLLSKIFGGFVLLFGLWQLFKRDDKTKKSEKQAKEQTLKSN